MFFDFSYLSICTLSIAKVVGAYDVINYVTDDAMAETVKMRKKDLWPRYPVRAEDELHFHSKRSREQQRNTGEQKGSTREQKRQHQGAESGAREHTGDEPDSPGLIKAVKQP